MKKERSKCYCFVKESDGVYPKYETWKTLIYQKHIYNACSQMTSYLFAYKACYWLISEKQLNSQTLFHKKCNMYHLCEHAGESFEHSSLWEYRRSERVVQVDHEYWVYCEG